MGTLSSDLVEEMPVLLHRLLYDDGMKEQLIDYTP